MFESYSSWLVDNPLDLTNAQQVQTLIPTFDSYNAGTVGSTSLALTLLKVASCWTPKGSDKGGK